MRAAISPPPPAAAAASTTTTPPRPRTPAALTSIRSEAAALQRFAALNYMAVIKATKKRAKKRAAAAAEGAQAAAAVAAAAAASSIGRLSLVEPSHPSAAASSAVAARAAALARLAAQPFFTSASVASLATRAALLADGGDGGSGTALPPSRLDCPVCLSLLDSPVLLTCGHAFCWKCTASVVGTAAARGASSGGDAGGERKGRKGEGEVDVAASAASPATPAPPSSPSSSLFFFDCPCCRKPHASSYFDGLGVDAALEAAVSAVRRQQAEAAPEPGRPWDPTPGAPPPLLPPPAGGVEPDLTVVLDLDGTLIASYPPSRAGDLLGGGGGGARPAAFVAPGGGLNPGGVLVLERPGLGDFLRGLAALPGVEVVFFTAGLAEYAAPIMDALAARHGGAAGGGGGGGGGPPAVPAPSHRLFRPATSPGPAYPCIKDLGRLGRDLGRTLIVEDTALAFLAHPDNGVPVIPFRGDGDDRILVEAVLPLVAGLAADARGVAEGRKAGGEGATPRPPPFDVRPALAARFGMRAWFEGQGVVPGAGALVGEEARVVDVVADATAAAFGVGPPPPQPAGEEDGSTDEEGEGEEGDRMTAGSSSSTAASAAGDAGVEASLVAAAVVDGLWPPEEEAAAPAATLAAAALRRPALAVFDFDHTLLTHGDIGEEVVADLAPELVPLLQSIQMPANFIPLTNAVLAEAARRGVPAAAWAATAAAVGGRGLAAGGAATLRALASARVPSAILSDANDLFIGAALAAVGCGPGSAAGPAAVITNTARFGVGAGASSAGRLTIIPRHPETAPPHACPRCPANLCKGRELVGLRAGLGRGGPLVYAGDGENDLCPALGLGPGDALLVRTGRGLERLLLERAAAAGRGRKAGVGQGEHGHPALDAAGAPRLAGGLAPGVAVFGWDRPQQLAALIAALVRE